MRFTFPENFLWGVASSAFQMEGGMYEGGKDMNIREAAWLDSVKRGGVQVQDEKERPALDLNWVNPESPSKFRDNRSPEVGCDFYHKYPEDIKLFASLGIKMFRFSIQWGRIISEYDGEPNQAGIDYYNKVIDEMIANGIQPFFDLWHSDLPCWVLDRGGFISDDFVSWFSRFAEICFKEFGDRVKYWSSSNESHLNAFGPYAMAMGAPYKRDMNLGLKAAHHMVLAHFEAVRLLRKLWPDAKIGSVHNTSIYYCLSHDPKDMEAAERSQASQFILSDPMILGKYPQELLDYEPFAKYIPQEYIDELAEKFIPCDFIGLNYYQPGFARAGDREYYGTQSVKGINLPTDAYPFRTYANGLYDLLLDLQERYNGLEMIVTENGYTQRREDVFNMDLTPFHQDTSRQEYIREHARACSRAIRAGANLTGYFYWSCMDLWESSMGYGYPMGLVAVNFDTLERFPRESFYYYQKIVRNNLVD